MSRMDRLRLCCAWLTLALATGLLYFKITLNSDSFFLEDLASDLFIYGGSWANWKFTPAPAYVPDMLLYFLGYALLPSVPLRIFFVTVCQAFMLAILSLWLARKIQPQLSTNGRGLIILLIAFASLVASSSGMWLFFNSTNNHVSSFLFSLFSLGLVLDFLERPKLLTAVLIMVVGGVAKASSAVFLICFVLPVIAVSLLAVHISFNQSNTLFYKNRIFALIGVVIGSQLIAAVISKVLTYHDPIQGRVAASAESAGNSLKLFLQATKGAFSTDNGFTLAFSLVVVSAFGFLVYRLLRQVKLRIESSSSKSDGLHVIFPVTVSKANDWRFCACAVLLIFTVLINISAAILSGGIIDSIGYRYFMFPIGLGLLLSIILIDIRQGAGGWKSGYIYLTMLALLVGCLSILVKKIDQNKDKIQSSTFLFKEDKVAACLIKMEKEGFFLGAGMSDYWYARGVTQLMPRKNPIIAITNDLSLFFWMSTIGPIIRAESYPERHYNFVILRNPEHGFVFDFTPLTVGKLLPTGYSVHYCKGTDVQVWHYREGQLDLTVRAIKGKSGID